MTKVLATIAPAVRRAAKNKNLHRTRLPDRHPEHLGRRTVLMPSETNSGPDEPHFHSNEALRETREATPAELQPGQHSDSTTDSHKLRTRALPYHL
jgi:hypothetical protein